jgi:hypothetical protein
MPTRRRTKLENATEPKLIKSKGMVHQGWLNVPNSSHKELVAQRILPTHTHTHSLSLSLSLTHTHTHNLEEYILIEFGAMPFCLLQKPLFFFTYYGSL